MVDHMKETWEGKKGKKFQIRNKVKEGRSFGNTLKQKEERSLGNGSEGVEYKNIVIRREERERRELKT